MYPEDGEGRMNRKNFDPISGRLENHTTSHDNLKSVDLQKCSRVEEITLRYPRIYLNHAQVSKRLFSGYYGIVFTLNANGNYGGAAY